MDIQEIEILTRLRDQFNEGIVIKKTVIKGKDIWNKHHVKADWITYCMCTSVRRKIYAKQIIEWYESIN